MMLIVMIMGVVSELKIPKILRFDKCYMGIQFGFTRGIIYTLGSYSHPNNGSRAGRGML